MYVINVSFEPAGIYEFSRALCAFVRLLAVVPSKMHLQARLGDERLLAIGTLVFTNIQVAFLVSTQISSTREGAITLATLMHSNRQLALCRMHPFQMSVVVCYKQFVRILLRSFFLSVFRLLNYTIISGNDQLFFKTVRK